MHALITTFRMDAARFDAQVEQLHTRIIPFVRHQPGFRAGSWAYDRAHDAYVSYLTFETEEQARGLLAFIEADAPTQRSAGVAFESGRILEVQGHVVA